MSGVLTLTLQESLGGAWLCHWAYSDGRAGYVACRDKKAAERWAQSCFTDGQKPSWVRPDHRYAVTAFRTG